MASGSGMCSARFVRRTPLSRTVGCAVAVLLLAAVSPVPAQTNFFWTNANLTASWSTAASWTNLSPGSAAPQSGGSNEYIVAFTRAAGPYTNINDLGTSSFLLNQLLFTDGTSGTVNVRGSNLVFVANSDGGLPLLSWRAQTVNVDNALVLSNNLTATAIGAATLSLKGAVSGPGGITKSGNGLLYFQASNSFSGGLTIEAGTLGLLNNNAAGTGTLTINGGTITGGGIRSVLNPISVGGDWTLSGGALNFASNVDLTGATRTFTVNGIASNSVFRGVFSNGGLVKAGPGRLVFSNAASTYTGGTLVSSGALALAQGASLASGVQVSNNATFQVTGGVSTVSGAVTNLGRIEVLNAKVTWGGPAVISGSYFSDPSTNIFTSNATVTASGSLYGSNGDLFVFNQDFINQSTNRTQFNLANATVLFTNGTGPTTHTLSLANSSALDLGSNWLDHTQLATNFAIGTLSIASGNLLTLSGDKASQTNALYVGWLDLTAWATNASSLTNTLQSALSLPNINLYYDKYADANAYLQGQTYSLWSGGALIPIPEPTSLALLLGFFLAAGLVAGRKSSSTCR